MSGKCAQSFASEIVFANQLVCAAGKKVITVRKQFEDFAFGRADFVGAFAFFHIPEMDFFVASTARDKFVVWTEGDRLDGPIVASVSRFKFAADGIDGSQPFAGLIQDKNGTFWGTTFFGGPEGYGTVYKLTP